MLSKLRKLNLCIMPVRLLGQYQVLQQVRWAKMDSEKVGFQTTFKQQHKALFLRVLVSPVWYKLEKNMDLSNKTERLYQSDCTFGQKGIIWKSTRALGFRLPAWWWEVIRSRADQKTAKRCSSLRNWYTTCGSSPCHCLRLDCANDVKLWIILQRVTFVGLYM